MDTPVSNCTPPEQPAACFRIVGIGASAGGLAASSELLQELGPRPGVALVVVQHLDPAQESGLVGIFSRISRIPVETARDGVRLQPNHAYVVPPNAGLLLADGLLRLIPRIEEGGLHLPIDRFFASLAEDCQLRAIGVLLSGSGSDGSLGIRAIKAAGGITFAQDASAEYQSMPGCAIATGCVDFVMSPAAIARELSRVGAELAPERQRDEALAPPTPEFARLLAALRTASGIDFANYKPATIVRRAQRRVSLQRMGDLREYVELLERDPAECSALAEEVLIHVTSFFRDPATFAALATRVFPRLIEQLPRGAPIRLWVAGCSTGEEVYSFAISLLEFLESANAAQVPIKIFGTDVSAHAIERARAGRYAEGIEQGVSAGRLATFFSKVGSLYQVRKDLRDLCVFARHDATRDPPFSGMHLVSCRNLMIYLGVPLQARLLSVFHYALVETGFLVLGSSETTHASPGFATLDAKAQIYQRTPAAPRLLFDFAGPEIIDPVPRVTLAAGKGLGPLDVHREADRVVLARFAPPGLVVTDDLAIVQFRGKTAPFLEPASGIPSLALQHMVREELRLPLRQLIEQARSEERPVRKSGVQLTREVPVRLIELDVLPLPIASTTQRFFVVLFRDVTPESCAPLAAAPGDAPGEGEPAVVSELRQELTSTRQYLEVAMEQAETAYEELKTANEEITSSNEELRSTNEELQMAKQELEATNEELRTVNDEMGVRNLEANRLSDDLANVLSSVEIPIVLLGREAKIRRFAPAAAGLLGLAASDIGRPLSDIRGHLAAAAHAMAAEVFARILPAERTLQNEAGHWYQLSVRPYLTLNRQIEGTVVSAIDVDAAQRAAQLVRDAQTYAESVVDTVRESLLVVDSERCLRSANRAFYRIFGSSAEQSAGRRLRELLPVSVVQGLDRLLDALAAGDGSLPSRLEQVVVNGELRVFLATARRIEGTRLVLLALADVTESERTQELRRSERELRDVLTTASEGILMVSPDGLITFTNEALTGIVGYAAQEMLGQSVDVLVPERLREQYAAARAAYMLEASPRRMGQAFPLFLRHKDGTEVEIEIALCPQMREGGLLVVCFVTDVTERRASERQIFEYQRKLQQMAFDAALTEEAERRRIAADLHDRIGQSLALAQMKLKAISTTDPVGQPVADAIDLLDHSIVDMRTLIFDLSPPILYELGLREALLWLAEDLGKRWGMQVSIVDDGLPKPLVDATAAIVFRAVRELLTNVLKHAQILAVKVTLQRRGDELEIGVADEGVGFDVDAVTPASEQGSFGLFSVREQLSRLGGALEIRSAPGVGTQVSLRVALAARAALTSSTSPIQAEAQ